MKNNVHIMVLLSVVVIFSIVFAVHGVKLHSMVDSEESNFHWLQEQYYSINKSERDSAGTGSELNRQLVEIEQYPSELMRLKLVGLGKILTGIYLMLFGILLALILMPPRLKEAMRHN